MSSAFRFAVFTCLALITTTWTVGQESDKPLTVEEIVARHEATWEKLRCYSIAFTPQEDLSTPENRRKPSIGTDKPRASQGYELLFHRDGERYCIVEPLLRRKGERREFVEADRYVMVEPESVIIELPSKAGPAFDRAALGEVIMTNMQIPGYSLRRFVESNLLKLEQGKNDGGDPIYIFSGKVKVRKPLFDDGEEEECNARITVNAARGYLIEEYAFDFERRKRWFAERCHSWRVVEWPNNAETKYFPKSVQFESKIWRSTENMLSRWSVQTIDLSPQERTAAMQCQIPDKAVVEDRTGRTGLPPFAIWGEDGKPRITFASEAEYDVHRIQKIRKRKAEGMEVLLGILYPEQCIDLELDADGKFKKATIVDSKGEVVHEFESQSQVFASAIFQLGLVSVLRLSGNPQTQN